MMMMMMPGGSSCHGSCDEVEEPRRCRKHRAAAVAEVDRLFAMPDFGRDAVMAHLREVTAKAIAKHKPSVVEEEIIPQKQVACVSQQQQPALERLDPLPSDPRTRLRNVQSLRKTALATDQVAALRAVFDRACFEGQAADTVALAVALEHDHGAHDAVGTLKHTFSRLIFLQVTPSPKKPPTTSSSNATNEPPSPSPTSSTSYNTTTNNNVQAPPTKNFLSSMVLGAFFLRWENEFSTR